MGHAPDNHAPVSVDPQAVKDAERIWDDFTKLTKYSIIGVIAVLIGMAVFLL